MDCMQEMPMCPMMNCTQNMGLGYNNMNQMMPMCPMMMKSYEMQGYNIFQPRIKFVKLEEIRD